MAMEIEKYGERNRRRLEGGTIQLTLVHLA